MSPRSVVRSAYLATADFPEWALERRRDLARLNTYVGPAFLVSVGYVDPGNWATDLEAGSRFGYRLLWVILVSNIVAIVVQNLSARLGIVTGISYAENCRRHFPPPVWLTLWLAAEAALVATDVAEFMGAILGFELLLGVGSPAATALSVLAAFAILALYRYGDRSVERTLMSLIAVIGLCYATELTMAAPDWVSIAHGTFRPWLDRESSAIAAGILGATVMPHNLFLHSAVVRREDAGKDKRFALRSTLADSLIALNASWLINAAILIMAAAVFFTRGEMVSSIEQAHATLIPLLGPLAGGAFALGLLAAGISSSATATLTGQIVLEGFLGKTMNLFTRRALTLVPALLIIALGLEPYRVLIASQIALSAVLPFALIPLVVLTARRTVMGQYTNRMFGNWLAIAATLTVLWFNGMLLFSLAR